MIVLPTEMLTVSFRVPLPLAVLPFVVPVLVLVKVTPVKVAGKVSAIVAPLTLLGPLFETVIV